MAPGVPFTAARPISPQGAFHRISNDGAAVSTTTPAKYTKNLQLKPVAAVLDDAESPQYSQSKLLSSPATLVVAEQCVMTAERGGGARSLSPASPRRSSPNRNGRSSPRLGGGGHERPRQRQAGCHVDLYEDAFARQKRLQEMRACFEQSQQSEESRRVELFEQGMRERRRIYRMKDTRTQMEREEELIRRRKAKEDILEIALREREEEELRECTFKPSLIKKPGAARRQRSPRSGRTPADEDVPPAVRLRQLVERQRQAAGAFQGLSVEETSLREHLRTVHADLHDRIQREETQRVVAMLQDTDTDGSAQRELIQRVRRMVSAGHDPEQAQKQIVEELVARSQDEVKRRVLEAFGPTRLESEGDFYSRRLAVVHDLEATEAAVIALKGGSMIDEAKDVGFEFGLAEKMRRLLPPVLSTTRSEAEMMTFPHGHERIQSTCSSMATPRAGSHPPGSATPSRQSSGPQPSLSGSVLQPLGSARGDQQESAASLHTGAATGVVTVAMSSGTSRSLLGAAMPIAFSAVQAATEAARQAQAVASNALAARNRVGPGAAVSVDTSTPTGTGAMSPMGSRTRLLSFQVPSEGDPCSGATSPRLQQTTLSPRASLAPTLGLGLAMLASPPQAFATGPYASVDAAVGVSAPAMKVDSAGALVLDGIAAFGGTSIAAQTPLLASRAAASQLLTPTAAADWSRRFLGSGTPMVGMPLVGSSVASPLRAMPSITPVDPRSPTASAPQSPRMLPGVAPQTAVAPGQPLGRSMLRHTATMPVTHSAYPGTFGAMAGPQNYAMSQANPGWPQMGQISMTPTSLGAHASEAVVKGTPRGNVNMVHSIMPRSMSMSGLQPMNCASPSQAPRPSSPST